MSPRLLVMFWREPFVPPTTTAARSPATKLPFFSDLSGDRWQSIKYIISNVSFYLAALSLRERCLIQQKILLPSSPQREAYNCLFAGVTDGGNKHFLLHQGDAPWPYLERRYLGSDTEQTTGVGRGRRRSKEHGQMSIRRHPVTWWCDHTRTVSQWRVSVHFRLLPFNLPVCVGGGNDCEIQDVMECVLLALNLRSGDSSPSHSKVVPFTPLPGPAPSGEAVGWIQVLHFLT